MNAARTATLLSLLCLGGGCAGNQCLQLPVSSKISDGDVATCRRALEGGLDRRDFFHRYVEQLRVRGEYAEIERWSRRVLEANGKRTDALYYLAFALRKQGRYQQALAAYGTYAEVRDSDPDPLFGSAICYEKLGDRPAAIEAYDRYLKREQRQARESWRVKARERIAALRSGAAPSAVARAAPRPAARPTPAPVSPVPVSPAPVSPAPAVRTPPVAAPAVAPPPTEDCRKYETAIAANPFATDAYDRFASCAAAAGRHTDVVAKMRIAIRDNPDYARGWLHLGRAQRTLGQDSQATASLAKACAAGVTEACGS